MTKINIEKIVVPEIRASSQLTTEQRAFFEGTIEKYGVLQDLLVRPLPDGNFELIAGKTRLLELQKRGMTEVDVKIIEADAKDALMMHLAENYARGSVEPISTARVIQKALEEGSTVDEIALVFNHKKGWVKFMVGLLKLPEVYQQALAEKRIKVTHVREAMRLPDLREADAALSAALTHSWSTPVMHHYVNNRLAECEAARRVSEKTGTTVPPPPPEPEQLVRYGQCLVCGNMVPREEIHLPAVCTGCYELSKYVISQCGTGKAGMDRIYKALELQQAWDARQRQFMTEQEIRTQPPETFSPPPPPETVSSLPEKSTVIGDDKLRALVKKMMREELERQSP